MSFADNLKAVRKERNISQEDLAELLNVSRQAVSKWEQGTGYPEMEKMITLSQKLNVSLDFLISGEREDPGPQKQGVLSSGKITIQTHDSKKIVNCHKIYSSSLSYGPFKCKDDEPQYVLFGVEGLSFWGEQTIILGWYADEENVKKELDAIMKAMKNGEASYQLKYNARVKQRFLSVKLDES